MTLRLTFVWLGVPRFGIRAFLAGMLASEIFLSVLHLVSLKKLAPFSWDAAELIAKPALLLVISVGVLRFFTGLAGILPAFAEDLPLRAGIFFLTAAQIFMLSAVYGALLLLFSGGRKYVSRT